MSVEYEDWFIEYPNTSIGAMTFRSKPEWSLHERSLYESAYATTGIVLDVYITKFRKLQG